MAARQITLNEAITATQKLTTREQEYWRYRIGSDDIADADIAKLMGVTRQWVSELKYKSRAHLLQILDASYESIRNLLGKMGETEFADADLLGMPPEQQSLYLDPEEAFDDDRSMSIVDSVGMTTEDPHADVTGNREAPEGTALLRAAGLLDSRGWVRAMEPPAKPEHSGATALAQRLARMDNAALLLQSPTTPMEYELMLRLTIALDLYEDEIDCRLELQEFA